MQKAVIDIIMCAGVSVDVHFQLLWINTRTEFVVSYGNMICKTQVKPVNTVNSLYSEFTSVDSIIIVD